MISADQLSEIASGLALWPGLLLVAGGVAKAVDTPRRDVRGTVLARLITGRRSLRAAWGTVAAAELTVGVLVLAGLAVPWPEAAAALLLAAAALLMAWGLRRAPDAGCGCFGARATTTVSVRALGRAGYLAVLAALAALGGSSWWTVFGDPAAAAAAVAAGAALAWLSPELPALWRQGALRLGLRVRRVRETACWRGVPVDRTVSRLRRSELWQRAQPYVSADTPTEHWDEGCWRLLCYPAVYEGESVTAVFALRLGLQRGRNRVAFVNEADRRILGRLEASSSRS